MNSYFNSNRHPNVCPIKSEKNSWKFIFSKEPPSSAIKTEKYFAKKKNIFLETAKSLQKSISHYSARLQQRSKELTKGSNQMKKKKQNFLKKVNKTGTPPPCTAFMKSLFWFFLAFLRGIYRVFHLTGPTQKSSKYGTGPPQ